MLNLTERVAQALLEIDAVGFSPHSPIRFKSGILSPIYVDNRCLPFHPPQWRIVIEGFRALIAEQGLTFDVVAGVAVGGVPHSAALAYTLGCPSVFVRKEAKEHGRGKQVEGGSLSGQRTLLVEDLVTTGGSSLAAVAALRAEDARVDAVVTIVSYGFAEAEQAFTAAGVRLYALTHLDALITQARALGKLSESDAAIVAHWYQNPHDWTPT
ncbi:MAG: orotate phosphoribosyltransferase [Anaerolineae bacterium]|nr:orotate phosphoribosyltransferase [Anaerolineae bacterium]